MVNSQVHLIFDLLAALSALVLTILVYDRRLRDTANDPNKHLSYGYIASLVLGAAIGGYGIGTANLWLSGHNEIGRSILGALAGAIASIEIYKSRTKIKGSTGLLFVVGLTTSIVIGRIGCLLSGLEDFTYGVPTMVNWGWDYGDGIPRHPVQLYESLTMGAFLVCALYSIWYSQPLFLNYGFYLFVGFYSAQRFFWEFLKPYTTVLGDLNIFHLLCLALVCYSGFMIGADLRRRYVRT